MSIENNGRRFDDAQVSDWVEENVEALDKPLSNRGFLLGVAVLAEAIVAAKGSDSKRWQAGFSGLKKTFVADWRRDQ
jgi:hypothetical protein